MPTVRYLILPFLYLFVLIAEASQPSIRFEHLSVEDGLPQSSPKAILQDRQGFLWVGTQDGLARYDAYSYRVFKREEGNRNSLSANYIRVLYEDRQGYIWVGTDRGLNRFDPKTEQFQRYFADDGGVNSVSGDNIGAIAEDQDGNLWFGTLAQGLNRFNPTTEVFEHYAADAKENNRLVGNSVRAIAVDSTGVLWIGTDEGLNRLNVKSGEFTLFRYNPNDRNSLSGIEVNAITEDRNGIIWIGTHGGLNRLDPIALKFTHYHANDSGLNSLSNNTVRTIYQDVQGIIWVGTNDGLNRFDPDTEIFTSYRVDANNPDSLSSNSIYVITQDRDGFIWLGTYAGGLNYFNPNIEQFNHYRSNANDPYSLSNNNIFSMAVDQNNVLWVGTSDGLNRYDPETGRFSVFRYNPNNENSLRHNVVLAILEDRKGRLWLGTPKGLSYLDETRRNFVHFVNDPNNPNSLNNNVVSAITEDRQGSLWIGTLGGGLNRFNPDTQTFNHYQFDPANPKSLSHDRVKTILEDQRGAIWVGTRGGLNRLDPETGLFERFSLDARNSDTSSKRDQVNNDVIFSIIEDHIGILWVGTNNGMYRLNTVSGAIEHFNETDGLPNNVIYNIQEDKGKDLWMSTNNGLAHYARKTGKFRTYYATHGLQNNEFNGGASFKSDRGELFFGGINGFNRFYPDKLKIENQEPVVVFTDMLLLNESVPIIPKKSNSGNKTSVVNTDYRIEQAVNYTTAITLTHRESLVAFEFSSLHFSNPKTTRYAYKLEGFDSDWITASYKNRRATYTNLPSGDFILHVKASNFDDVWSEKPNSIRITVLPPPWLSWWAYTIYFLILVSSISLYIRKQRMKVILERNLLEAQIQKRTKAIRTLADIAKDISSTLTIEQLIAQLHSHLVKSLNLSVLALGVLEKNENHLRFESCLENGKTIPMTYRQIDSQHDLAGWCVTHNKEVLLKQYSDRFELLTSSNDPIVGGKMESVIYLPIRSRSEQMLGCLTVQSDQIDAFSDDDIDFIRTISNYAGIALDNIISHQELKRMSSTDYLTSLPNRRAFLENCNYLMKVARRSDSAISLALADIDHFKQFNDQFGHDCGDFVLQKVASLFRSNLREQDIVARWGGEEFIFLFPNTAIQGGVTVLEKLRVALEEHSFEYEGRKLTIKATFGISMFDREFDLDTVVDQADLALYEGKNSGRNRVHVFKKMSA